jgi:hypothetical protein
MNLFITLVEVLSIAVCWYYIGVLITEAKYDKRLNKVIADLNSTNDWLDIQANVLESMDNSIRKLNNHV